MLALATTAMAPLAAAREAAPAAVAVHVAACLREAAGACPPELRHRALLQRLYAAHGDTPRWLQPARSGWLRGLLASADHDGLTPGDYHATALAALDEVPGVRAAAWRDLLLSDALAGLAYHLHFGKANPRELDRHWNFAGAPDDADVVAWLSRALDEASTPAPLASLRPDNRYYAGLRDMLARYRDIAGAGGWPAVPDGPLLKPGAADARLAPLRRRLLASADLDPAVALDPDHHDTATVAALQAFQRRHGLAVDGVLGPHTLAALNVGVSRRIDQIRVNLERLRWISHDIEPAFVAVNIASFHAAYVRDREVVWRSRAIVGREYRATPVFRAAIRYLELNPSWTVPPTILRKDVLPAIRAAPDYLERHDMQVIGRDGRAVDPAGIDWQNARAGRFPYLIRQRPGAANALGRIKFIFPNPYAVYLHDTPKRALFEHARRDFSSGCIRIEDPLGLAELLLGDAARWPRAHIEQAIASGVTRRVDLPQPVTVMILYLTAYPGADGTAQFRRDLYGRDAAVRAALDASPGS